jgi:hypothetical protein
VSLWTFDVLEARPERFAAVPTLMFRVQIGESTGASVHAIALKTQIRIEPQRRAYGPAEVEGLFELFGDGRQWHQSLKPMLWTHVSSMVPAFSGRTEIDIPVACTYDFDVASAKYFHALGAGDIPLVLLFSGTVFLKTGGAGGFSIEQVPWDREATYRLPVAVWRSLMDDYFPGSAWIRLGRDSFDALHRFRGRGAFTSWDAAIEALLAGAERPRAS